MNWTSSDQWRVGALLCVGVLTACVQPLEGELPGSPGSVIETSEASDSALSSSNQGGDNLAAANLAGNNLAGANLGAANLGGNNLAANNLAGNNLGGTNLGGNNLAGNNLASTNLAAANLAGNNLAGNNLAGSNLAASNLAGSNLGAANLAAANLASSNLAAANLAASNAAMNIHGLAAANGMLFSGEDKLPNKADQCIVMGIGSTAMARLINENKVNNAGTMKAAIKQLPWGFSTTTNGVQSLAAWEAVVWGTRSYCVFVLVAPPGATFSGVAGFIKAIWRWQAPLTMSLDIGQIGGGQTVVNYPGMMDTARLLAAGTISEKALVGAELGFIAATVNNQTVNVDFASWVIGTNGSAVFLGNVSPSPTYFEASYVVLDKGADAVAIGVQGARRPTAPVTNAFTVLADAWSAYGAPHVNQAPRPLPKRCAGALFLNFNGRAPIPAGKCDSGVQYSSGSSTSNDYTWTELGGGNLTPYNNYMVASAGNYRTGFTVCTPEGCSNSSANQAPVLSETYIHLNETPFDYQKSYRTTPTTSYTAQSVAVGAMVPYGPFTVADKTAFEVVMLAGSGDADLHVRWGAAPTTATFNCRPYQDGSNERCTMAAPAGGGQAYVMVHGYLAATYDLHITALTTVGGGDTVGPIMSLISPTAGQSLNATSQELRAAGEDKFYLAKIEWYRDANILIGTHIPAGSGLLKVDGQPIFAAPNVNPSTWGAGNHTVYLKAYDLAGNVSTTSAITVSVPAPPTQRLTNTGFESGTTGWTATAGVINNTGGSLNAKAGTYKAQMNGKGIVSSHTVSQSFSIPSTATSATLSLFLKVTTAESTFAGVLDTLKVQILDGTTTTVLATYSNKDKSSSYVQKSFSNLATWKGKTVTLQLVGTENATNATTFFVDEVSVLSQ